MNALLSAAHAEELRGSGIAPELVAARWYQTIGPESRGKLLELGFPAWAVRSDDVFPALLVPMYRPKTGTPHGFQLKPQVPQAKTGTDKAMKYVSPRGQGNRLDVHPSCTARVADPKQTLWITEGVKKGDCLATLERAVVSVTGVWNWRNTEGSVAEWEDVPLKDREVIVCFDSDAITNRQVMAAMKRLVGFLRSRGATALYLPVPAAVAGTPVKGVDDFFAAGGTPEVLRAAASERAPRDERRDLDASFTDAFLTDTVCEETLEGEYLYARNIGWLRYDGARWADADESGVVEQIRQWAKDRWTGAIEEYKGERSRENEDRMGEWRKVLASSRLKALASLARGPLTIEADEFDAHPDLLNCPNGVVDLRTGELLEQDPSYLFTKVAGAAYHPGADSADFRQALRALPDELHDWYQVRVGQSFTGYMTPDDVMLVQQGGGENGKSTLGSLVRRTAGTFAVRVTHRVLMGNPSEHPTELMDFRGARYAIVEETPEARHLDVQKVKDIVGTPDMKGRRMRQDFVSFQATHALFINTNHIPLVTETDHAAWRRLLLVKFPYTYRRRAEDVTGPYDRLGDPGLRERCQSEESVARACLAWAVQGAVRWYQLDRVMPEPPVGVALDTAAWRREGDLIHQFADERLQFRPDGEAGTQDVFQAFSTWLASRGHKPWSQKLFHSRFLEHHMVTTAKVEYSKRRTGGRYWSGVALLPAVIGMQ